MLTDQQKQAALMLADLNQGFNEATVDRELGLAAGTIAGWLQEWEFHDYYSRKLQDDLFVKTAALFKRITKRANDGDLEAAKTLLEMIALGSEKFGHCLPIDQR